MKKKLFNLVMALMLMLAFLGANIQSASASTPKSISSSSFPGSIRCGTLKGWGNWRRTESIARVSRTIIFEPSRTGKHQLQFYLEGGSDGAMTPYWSNNGGSWTSWSRVQFNNGPRDWFVPLRTDSTKTIYKFIFYSGVSKPGYIWYRFYCA